MKEQYKKVVEWEDDNFFIGLVAIISSLFFIPISLFVFTTENILNLRIACITSGTIFGMGIALIIVGLQKRKVYLEKIK